MKIRLGKKIFEFNDIQLDKMYIDEGMEGTIYRLGEDALKIYSKYPAKDRLNEEEALKLSKIVTERFLLPKKLIYDEDNNFIGYSTKFIEDYDFKNVRYLPMNEFCSELDILYNELKSLNDNLVDVEDYSLYNAIYNGEIYIVAGPIFKNDEKRYFGVNKIPIPDAFFKVVLCTSENPKALGFVFPNNGTQHNLQDYVLSVDEVENVTGIDFFPALPDSIEEKVEAYSNLEDWK